MASKKEDSDTSEKMDVPTVLRQVFERLVQQGVQYPPRYLDYILSKYGRRVKYPRIMQRVGDPNIRRHPHYPGVLAARGRLLDFGCGTGDDIRALIADGYPADNIVGYDVDWTSIDLGFDLYLDRKELHALFRVSPVPPFYLPEFTVIYSGSILHVMPDLVSILRYLKNAFQFLMPGGFFLGSTLGVVHPTASTTQTVVEGHRHLFLIADTDLADILNTIGFTDIEVTATPLQNRIRLWFFARKAVPM